MSGLISELKRRNVVRVAVAYGVVSWLIIQITGEAVPALNLPEWVGSLVFFLLLIGLPIAILFAWAFELTPDGLKRTKEVDVETSVTGATGQKINFIIIGALVLALGYFAWDKFAAGPGGFGASGEIVRSVAVLPFVNMSNDPDQEFFSDGISEELLNVLAKMPGLKVAARTSSFQFKGENRDISDIGRQLGVAYVLEGSVRKSGTRIRITAQLINVEDSFHIWSETYDRELTDIFAIQDEISAAIAKALQVHLGVAGAGDDGANNAPAPRVAKTTSPELYEHYLLGRHLINRRQKEALEAAVEHFQAVITGDPDYAPAWAGLGEATVLLENAVCCYGDLTREEVIARAEPAFNRALELDPGLAEGWAALGLLLNRQNKLDEELAAYDRAIELNPNLARAHMWRSRLLSGELGRIKEATTALALALTLDPLNVVANSNMAGQLESQGRFDEARSYVEKVIQLNPRQGFSAMGELLAAEGKLAEAIGWYHRAHIDAPEYLRPQFFAALALLELGLNDAAAPLIGDDYDWIAIARGDNDKAVADARARFFARPDDPGAISELGFALYAADDIDGALSQFRRLNEIQPNRLKSQFGPYEMLIFSNILRLAGENDEADQLLRDIRVEIDNRHAQGINYKDVSGWEAWLLAGEGRFEEAAAMYDHAVDQGYLDWDNFRRPLPEEFLEFPGFKDVMAKMAARRAAERLKLAEEFCAPSAGVPDSDIKASICGSLAGS